MSEPTEPVLRVVRGEPTPEELAALVAVVGAAGGGTSEAPRPPRSAWNDPSRLVRQPVRPTPGGWRASALPG